MIINTIVMDELTGAPTSMIMMHFTHNISYMYVFIKKNIFNYILIFGTLLGPCKYLV